MRKIRIQLAFFASQKVRQRDVA